MAKSYYVCPVIGTGQWGDPYRAKLRDQLTENGSGLVTVIASNPDGTPAFPWCLVLVSAVDHTVFAGADVDKFPEITLDSTLSVLTNQQRNALLSFLTKRGVPTNGLTTQSTFRDVIDRVGKHLDLTFSASNFDVG